MSSSASVGAGYEANSEQRIANSEQRIANSEQRIANSEQRIANSEQRIANSETQWPLWEVFTQKAAGEPHEHAGSVHAADAEMALQNARDVYGRRGSVVSMWVVPSNVITASPSDHAGPFFDPGAEKIYRHPQFYKIPRGLKGF